MPFNFRHVPTDLYTFDIEKLNMHEKFFIIITVIICAIHFPKF